LTNDFVYAILLSESEVNEMFYVKVTDKLLVRCQSLAEVQKVVDDLQEKNVEILIKNA
jgi:hypothetical protein